MAFDGTRYLIAWSQGGNILARRMQTDGALIDATPLPVMPGTAPSVAALGGVFLVACTDAPSSPQFSFPFVRRVQGDSGALIDPGPVAVGQYFARVPQVAALGGRWLVAWQRNFSHDDLQSNVDAAFVEPDGSVSPYFVVQFTCGTPELAASDDRALVAFRTNSPASANNDVGARILLADGTFATAPFIVSAALGRQLLPSVAWDGVRFWMSWEDMREQQAFYDARTDIWGARIAPDGTLLDAAGFLFASRPDPVARPALTAQGQQVLFGASLMRTDSPLGAYRLGLGRVAGDCADPVKYCTSLPNSTGQPAVLAVGGTGSFSANAMTLYCGGLPASGIGIFYCGTLPLDPGLPFGNGLRGVDGATVRLGPVIISAGNAAQLQDLSSLLYGSVAPGDTRHFQFWYRDPDSGGPGFNLSHAASVLFCN